MDLVTKNLLDSFRIEQDFPENIEESILFEHFANYCITSNEYMDEFDVEEIRVAGGNDLQLDGVIIIVNGEMVNSIAEVDDLAKTNRHLDAEFIFVQAKRSGNFDGANISNMFYGVRELLSQSPSLPRNEQLEEKEKIIRHIYAGSSLFKRGKPKLNLYYVTTGKWTDDDKLVSRINNEIATLEDLNIFQSPHFRPVDASRLQQYYYRSKNAISRTISFDNKITLPTIKGIKEAYLGYLPAAVYLEMITDEDGTLLRSLFYDNVRDFQGDNPVNIEIEKTLQSPLKDAFVLMNNGITIVSEELISTGNKFTLTGFQVVNGCQTSHVLFNNKDKIGDDIFLPIKIIIKPEDNLKNQVIKATNRQTEVKAEELLAITDFQKALEQYYKAIPIEHQLYYERRPGQYRTEADLEKIKIITISSQIKAFASMFLKRAHQASRYPGTLLKDIESKIFVEEHFPIAYYLSAYALFRIDSYLRRHQIDNRYRPFRYHLLSIIRMQVAGIDMPELKANKFEKYCEPLQHVLWDNSQCLLAVQNACGLLDGILSGNYDRDAAKDSTIQIRASERIEATSSSRLATRTPM